MSRPDPSFVLSAGVAQAVESELAVAYGKNYFGSSLTIGIFLYVAQPVERVLPSITPTPVKEFEVGLPP